MLVIAVKPSLCHSSKIRVLSYFRIYNMIMNFDMTKFNKMLRNTAQQCKHMTAPSTEEASKYGVAKKTKKLPILNHTIAVLAPINIHKTAKKSKS